MAGIAEEQDLDRRRPGEQRRRQQKENAKRDGGTHDRYLTVRQRMDPDSRKCENHCRNEAVKRTRRDGNWRRFAYRCRMRIDNSFRPRRTTGAGACNSAGSTGIAITSPNTALM